MADDLSALPIASLQLPSKTVSKLKPLGVRTIRELYALPLERLIDAGLVLRELEELAEAAPDFGVSWHGKEAVRSAVGPSAPAEPKRAAAKATSTRRKAGALPPDIAELYGAPPNEPPSADAPLRWYRRIRVLRATSIGGPERWYVVGVADVSRVPVERASELGAILLQLAHRLEDVLRRLGRSGTHALQLSGAAAVLPILAKDRPKAEALAEANAQWIGEAPTFAGEVPRPFVLAAAQGLLAAELHDEACALSPSLLEIARGLATEEATAALRAWSMALLGAQRSSEGVAALRTLLSPEALAAMTTNPDALVSAARVCVVAKDDALAIDALRRAFALDTTPVHLRSLRAEVIDDAAFAPLFSQAAFRALYRGYPAFEARLR